MRSISAARLSPTQRKRLGRLAAVTAATAALGLSYALLMRYTGLAVPCPFRELTGLLCPGCGVSRMCLSLLSGDLAAAWRYNPALLCISPLFAALVFDLALRYVKEGSLRPHKWANVLLWIMIIALLAFGVLRNL